MESLDDFDQPEPPEPKDPAENGPGQPRTAAAPRRRRSRRGVPREFWDALSLLLLVAAGLWGAAVLLIFQNPYIALNPFPPEPPIPTVFFPSATPLPSETVFLPDTWTPTATQTGTLTNTPVPATATLTLTPSQTSTPGPATPTPPAYPYLLRGQPNYLDGSVIPNHEGCKMWVAGQAFDMKGSPVIGITVQIGGTLDQKSLYLLSLTGTALDYGQGGYEFVLADKAIASKETVWIQLLDQELKPLSQRVFFSTQGTCDKNLILINFKQVK